MKLNGLKLVFASFAIVMLASCGADMSQNSVSSDDPRSATITPEGLQQRLSAEGEKPLVVDVREPQEWNAGHIAGAQLAPLGKVVDELAGVEKNREIVLVCRSGNRSGKAQKLLAERGFTNLKNMTGGMLAWEKRGYPVEK